MGRLCIRGGPSRQRRGAHGAPFGLGRNYYTGGATSVDGQPGNDLQRNCRLGATLAVPINPRVSFKVNASRGVWARTGNNFDLAGVAMQYRWGAGIP
jgi:hypothetical protein